MKFARKLSPRPREPPWSRERRLYLGFLAALALVAVAMRWSAIHIGLMSDDFMQHGMLIGAYPGEGYTPFDLYGFLRRGDVLIAHVEQGTAPWWSVPELHGTVLRPLSSLLLWLDYVLLPGKVELWHVHTLLWFAASIVTFGLVTRRLLPRSMAIIAVLLYACEAGMVSPLAWLANRCVLICATFGFLALWAHIEWRRPDPHTPTWLRRRGGLVVAVLMSASICAGEYGLGILAYLGAWELFAGQGPARQRLRALLPALIPVVAYLLTHKLLGYGTFGAEVYADPFHTPSGYVKWASKRVPKLMTAGFWSIPGATIHVFRFGLPARLKPLWLGPDASPEEFHSAHVTMALWGVAFAALALVLARASWSEDERRALRALGVGAFVGLFPIAVAPAHSRLLIIAQLGACVLVAAVLVGCVRLLLGPAGDREGARAAWTTRARGVALIPFAGLLASLHVVGDIRWGHGYIEHLDQLQASNIAAFTEGDLLEQELGGRDVVIINAPSQSLGLYGEFVLASEGWPMPATWRPLALGGEFAMVATRPAPDTLELSAIQGGWMHNAGELFFRREDQPLHTGDVLEYPSLRVEIVSAEGGHPSRIRFRFDRSLDDPRMLFVIATPRGLVRWSVPAVGARNVVPLPRLPPVHDPNAIHFPIPR